jgi:hypothetical protein
MMIRPAMLGTICILTLTFSNVAPLFGEELAKPVKITLHPQPAPLPSLKYRLLPTRLEQKRGNAVVHYGRVTAEEITFFSDRKLRDKIDDWQETPLEQLRGGKVHLPSKGHIEDSIRSGALSMECDWLLPVGDVPYYSMTLPDVQQSRAFGRILAVRARIQIADREYDDAITTLQTGYALGRHIATGETIVSGLVGNAVCGIMNRQVLDYVQQLGAPNLYWALTALPTPMIDMQRAFDVERMGIELSFPELSDARTAKKTPDEWQEQFVRIFSHDLGVQLSDNDSPKWWPSPDELDKRCRDRLPDAKRLLIASGLAAKEVEKMPLYQIATLYTLALYHEYQDDAIKYYNLPYPAAIAGMNAANERAKHDDREIVPLSKRLVSVVGINRSATARLERMFAVLRVFEALRIHAASHGEKLPKALDDITDVPIPNDPVTGKPFEYRPDADKAYLQGRTLQEAPLNYEITMIGRI